MSPEEKINVVVEYKLKKQYEPLTNFNIKELVLSALLKSFVSICFRARPFCILEKRSLSWWGELP